MTLSQAFILTVKKQKECRAAAAGSPTLIAFCVGVFALFFAALKIFDLGGEAAFVLLVLFFGLLFWVPAKLKSIGKAQDEYNEFYKEVFVRALIGEIDESFTYSAHGGISQSEFNAAGIFIGPARFTAKIACAAYIKALNLACAR